MREGRELGRGSLRISIPFPEIPKDRFPRSGLPIVAGAVITVKQSGNQSCAGRGANLWYGDLAGSRSFGWYEQSYMISASATERPALEPFGVSHEAHLDGVDEAHSPVTAMLQRASRLRSIEGRDLESFIERWLERFAAAARGALQKPASLPDEDVNAR